MFESSTQGNLRLFDNLFLIGSTIDAGSGRWTYTNVRSVFNPLERFKQSIETIRSIREHVPGRTFILFSESSLISIDQRVVLESMVDKFLDLSGDREIIESCSNSPKKGFGEACIIQKSLEWIKMSGLMFCKLFKISGRYFLTDKFVYDVYSFTKITFRKMSENNYFTVLYSVPFDKLGDYYIAIQETLKVYRDPQVHAVSLEEVLPSKIHDKHLIDTMGVSGFVAVDKATNLWYG